MLLLLLFFGTKLNQKAPLGKIVLLVFSLFFYSYWELREQIGPPIYTILFTILVAINYAFSHFLSRYQTIERKYFWGLIFILLLNFTPLLIYKYGYFIYKLFVSLRFDSEPYQYRLAGRSLHHLILPLGISFITFQLSGQTIDHYRSKERPAKSLLDALLFIFFFPQLIAGPIMRAKNLIPQFNRPRFSYKMQNFREGAFFLVRGMLKKAIFADLLAHFVTPTFSTLQSHSLVFILLSCCLYGFQIYLDFSGYSDMAVGLANFFDIDLKINFKTPYLSKNPQEFWRRWHISLSEWFRDYVYIPLGGSQNSTAKITLCILLTFALSGFWHGAGWNFLIWGLYHGVGLVLYRAAVGLELTKKLPSVFKIGLNYLFVSTGWLFFRISDLGDLGQVFEQINLLAHEQSQMSSLITLFLIGSGLHLLEAWLPYRKFQRPPIWLQNSALSLSLLLLMIFNSGSSAFIYFKF
ncbi:MAG: MBOAT family protein [Halobacteriovoraceae bacterium]|nr:MBOAT family protein [Halobacteriovoraceae bacterium]